MHFALRTHIGMVTVPFGRRYQRKCAEPWRQLEQRLMKASEFSQYDGLACTATVQMSCVPWP